MTWVWQHFRTLWVSQDDVRVRRHQSCLQRRCSSSDTEDDIQIQIQADPEASCDVVVVDVDESPPQPGERPQGPSGAVITCGCCQVSVLRSDRRHPRKCPYCGVAYPAAYRSHSRRVRSQRSCSDPILKGIRLPAIDVTDQGGTCASSGHSGSLRELASSRPGSDTSLPPIRKDEARDLRSAVSAESLMGMLPGSSPLGLTRDQVSPTASPTSCVDGQVLMYPQRQTSREEFVQEVRRAHQTENFEAMERFYTRTFESYVELCALFKVDADQAGARIEDPDLHMELLYAVHDALRAMPSTVHKTVLKAIIKATLQEDRVVHRKDEVRALFVLLQSPVFSAQHSYSIFAHLLRQIVALPSSDQQLLVHWIKILEVDRLRSIVQHLLQFITVRQFPPTDKSLPELWKIRWWIPTATRTLALINAANNASQPPLLHYSELYNAALDHTDLMQEYYNWQNPAHTGQFSYCQYPFILSIVAKRIILTKDSEQQMIQTARRALAAKDNRHQIPQFEIFFLNIHVRRSNLVNDSLNEIANKKNDLKRKLKVSFMGEPGVDMGGLSKEWFLLLIRQIFHPDYGMFVYYPHSRCYWFRMPASGKLSAPGEPLPEPEDAANLREYNLIGVLMGLAVYNSSILDLHFPTVCYRKLLSPPVVPGADSASVGLVRNPGIEDLADIMPDVARGLSDLMAYEGDVEEDMCLTFQASLEEYGDIKTYLLKEGGASVPVTNENRKEYVRLYLDWVLNTAIYHQFRAFYLGFHSVCASNALIMLRPEEVEMLVCGSPSLDLDELRKVTEYDGYSAKEPFITNFWSVLTDMSNDLKKKFLRFTTGSDRIPVGGMAEMTFKITKVSDRPENLPEAHTCFNHLVLPLYETREILQQKLTIAISNAEGFGLE